MNGSLYTWSNLNQYFASYLKYNGNPDIVPEDTAFLMPCIFLVQYCFMTIGVNLGNKVGPRFSFFVYLVHLMLFLFLYLLYFFLYSEKSFSELSILVLFLNKFVPLFFLNKYV